MKNLIFLNFIGISSVKHLNLDFNNNVSLTWSPPSFYSDDIPQGSITTYHVYVESEDSYVIADGDTTNTFYQLPNNFTVCNIYTANVTAFIEEYKSNKSSAKEYSGSKLT